MELVITVVGFGNIGKLISALLLNKREHQFHINIVDTDWNVFGAIVDLEHGAELYANHQISHNSPELFNNSDFIFHCAGASVPRGKSRLVTCQASIEITESIFKDFNPKKVPFIIVVANPVEIITSITQKLTGLPVQNVVGTGTFLDSLRMNYVIKKTNADISSVNAVLLGEHGTTAFLSEQLSTVNELPFSATFDRDTIDELMILVKASADEIKETQEATIYGVSHCALKIFETLLADEPQTFPVSTYIPENLSKQFGNVKAHLSLYSKVDNKGIQPIENYSPNQYELESFKESLTLMMPCFPKKYL